MTSEKKLPAIRLNAIERESDNSSLQTQTNPIARGKIEDDDQEIRDWMYRLPGRGGEQSQ
jgi:hypothetical protein